MKQTKPNKEKDRVSAGETPEFAQAPGQVPSQAAAPPWNVNERQRSNTEQLIARQSEPKKQQTVGGGNTELFGGIPGLQMEAALKAPIDNEAILKATQTLQKYKAGKVNLEHKIINNERWYKLRQWEELRDKEAVDPVEPTSAWLVNCILNKHADAMDNFPSPNILPREESDKAEAQKLSSIVPVVLDENEFENTYDEVTTYKLKTGTGVYMVTWDPSKCFGMGDISIVKADVLNLFWQPGITDIQKSRNLFHCELMDNETIAERYPQVADKLHSPTFTVAEYNYDDAVDTSEKSVVVDWYYKKLNSKGKQVLHYCKFVNDVVLYATENENQPPLDEKQRPVGEPMSETGLYDHGQYPFVFDTLFAIEGTPCGYGYIDLGKSAQEYIDRGNKALMQNMLTNSKPRYFSRLGGGINEKEFCDLSKDIVHVQGNIGQDVLPIEGKTLSAVYVQLINNKIDELKETTGNRDVSSGGTTGGVTAASALAAMMETGSKLSRDSNKSAYRAFKKVCTLVIELIRQFYTLPRCFRITGPNGAEQFIEYKSTGMQPQAQPEMFGMNMGERTPVFDIEVSASKQSPYSKMSQNEMALQFYQAGFFNPQMAQQALACLDMMDFDRKQFVIDKIVQNNQLMQQMMMLAQMIDGGAGPVSVGLAQQFGLPVQAPAATSVEDKEALGGTARGKEPTITKNARERVAESTSPT